MSNDFRDRERTPGRCRVRNWEWPAWTLLLLCALWSHFVQLGVRVMSHDESIHAMGSLDLLRQAKYVHDPAYHGPLLYHLNAAVYFLFGASDATTRLVPALMGVGVIASLLLFRRYLGRRGAFLAAVLATISPTLLFYGRHARNDIYVDFFAMLWIYGAMRYLEDRRRSWLYLVTVAMGVSFITKEVSFIFGGIVGAFFVGATLWARRGGRWTSEARAAGDLAVLMLSLVLPFASGLAYAVLGWDFADPHTSVPAMLRGGALIVGLLLAACALVAGWLRLRGDEGRDGLRLRDWGRMALLFWGLEVLFFTTFFSNLRGGLVSGVVGSVGYWLQQQDVARGDQPWSYYLLLAILYELPSLVFGLAAVVSTARGLRRSSWDPVPTEDLPAGSAPNGGALARRRGFFAFALWWALGSWLAYGIAGEKMPWLLTHQTLPLCLLGGWWLGRLSTFDWKAVPARRWIVLVGGTFLLPVWLAAVLSSQPFSGDGIEATAVTAGWMVRVVVLALAIALWLREAMRSGLRSALRLGTMGIGVLLLVLTLRTSIRLTFVTYDQASEHISYAQATPDVKRVMQEIELISERTAGERTLEVAYDDESTWPFVWYLRDYPNSRTWGVEADLARGAAVILVGPKNREALFPYVAEGYVKRQYQLMWWPVDDYRTMTIADLGARVGEPGFSRRLWRIVLHRDYSHLDLSEWPLRQEFDLYVREDLAASGWPSGPGITGDQGVVLTDGEVGKLQWQPEAVHAGPFAGRPLVLPTSLAVAADGSWIVADAGNHRILVLGRDGSLRHSFGSHCSLDQGASAECLDADGAGPLELGDGQFNEPWGVAVGADATIFVADTWNHRIQAFDRTGGWIAKWGRFGSPKEDSAGTDQLVFFGPRGLSIDALGRLVVADTGNKRLVVFDHQGAFLFDVGTPGVGPDQLDEPVGLAGDLNGTLLVADAWNRRVKRLDFRYRPLAVWPVPSWGSQDAGAKPFVAVDGAGWVYAADPEGGRVLVFSGFGRLEASLDLPKTSAAGPAPTGVAVDLQAEKLLVLDRTGGRLLVYSLYQPAPPTGGAGGG